jgi:hypothetical protein
MSEFRPVPHKTAKGGDVISRLLVTGSRDWTDLATIRAALTERFHPRTILVHGACPRGADAMANHVWRQLGGLVEPHPAMWQKHGKAAGPIRNEHMVKLGADVCLAFIMDGSPGATGCMSMAKKAEIPVLAWFETSH